MTTKTIGSFLSQLRKEKGITQKELAEYLNVSDKTVSHWECDKYSPDISIIPILAEFFAVSCDEILKGERAANKNYMGSIISESTTSEYEKYNRIRLHNAYRKLKTTMVINVFVCVCLVAILSNLCWLLTDMNIFPYSDGNIFIPLVAAFSAALFILIAFVAYQKFIGTLSFNDKDKKEVIHWKRKAFCVIAFPFVLCLGALLIFLIAVLQVPEAPTQPVITTQPPSAYAEFYDDTSETFAVAQSPYSQ